MQSLICDYKRVLRVVERGEVFALVGGSNPSLTTLWRIGVMEARQDRVLAGHVRFDDSPPAAKAASIFLFLARPQGCKS